MRSCFSIFVFLVFVATGFAQTDDERFCPPLKIKPVVSGSFGEIRTNHFHSGLDLATNGKQGYRVYSSEDGFVARIKVSPVGYGKALYIQHPDGYTTVYGHLQRFAPEIDSLVRKRQYEKQSYAIELFLKKGEIPVKKGEVIAFSGNSGSSGGPHLHYEIRKTNAQVPIDPLLFRNDVKDDIKPRIQGLKIYPLDINSRIEGRYSSKYLPAVYYDNVFHPKGQRIINASGKIGLGIQVLDYFSGSWRKCGVRSVELYVDSSRIFEADYSSIPFSETRYVNSLIDYGEKKRTGKVIQKSFVEPNNKLTVYKDLKNKGIINLKPGERKIVKYVVKDAAGNESDLSFILQGIAYPNDEPAAGPDNDEVVIAWDKPFTFSSDGISLNIPAASLYNDAPFYFEVDNDSTGFLSPVYVIGRDEVPVHKSFELSIRIPDSISVPADKIFIAGVTAKGRPFYLGGKTVNDEVKARLRGFGKFTLYADTIAPVVKLYRAPSANNYRGLKTIDVKIFDAMSGVKNYNCYIDGRWVLFEYDAKNNKLTGYKQYFPVKSGMHTMKIEAKDNCGNTVEKEYKITL
ncbi:MAG: M23 family metallopeptidase [Chlorobi bacterium]|nr:M23 family metallopeptidase [Chlorobiota bacterium]